MSLSSNLPAIPEALPVLKKDGAFLRLRPSPMRTNVIDGLIPSGTSLLFGLRKACRDAGIGFSNLRYAKVFVDGVPVQYEAWHKTLVREGQMVSVCIPLGKGGGGKNPLSTILQLVVVAVAAIATWYVGGTGAGWFGIQALEMGAGWGAVAGAAVMMGGMLLVNSIAGVSQPKLAKADTETAARVWSIEGAQNRADPYGPVPLVLGKIRFAPRFAAQYYSVLSGNDQFVRYLYVVGMGNVQVSDFRIGDTPFGNFQGSEYRIYQNWQGGGFAWFNRAVAEESLGVLLKNSVGWVSRTTKADTTHVALFFSFNGLKRIDNRGNAYSVAVELEVRYRAIGTSAWTYVSGTRSTGGGTVGVAEQRRGGGTFTIGISGSNALVVNGGYTIARGTIIETIERHYNPEHGNSWATYSYDIQNLEPQNGFTGSLSVYGILGVAVGAGSVVVPSSSFRGQTVTTQRRGVEFDVPEGQYEVSVRRVTPDSDKESTDQTIMDECTWTTLQSWRNRPAVVYAKRPLTLIEVQLKATEQLSGNVDEFNCYCQSVAPCWTGTLWEWRPTNNPASLALLVATSECTGEPADWDEMDLDSYADFYNWCERWGWTYNAVQTTRAETGELQHNIMGAGRGSYALLNGHGVVWDDSEAPVVEVLSPRNTWGFSAKKEFLTEPVQGLRMRFLNETKDFQEDERVVYSDGYDETNATNVIEWEQDGVTHPDLVWKHGRLRLAELRLRPETYTLNAEAESLTLRRGEHVRCQHDVTLWGIASGRIVERALDGEGRVISVDLDEECTMEAGKTYGIRVSTPTNPDVYYSIQTVPGVSRTLLLAMPIPVTSTTPDIGDLVAFGVAGHESQLLTILGITPSEGITAQITLQDAATNIYDAISGQIPAWDSNITLPTRYQANKPPTPRITNVISDESVLTALADGTLMPRILLNWEVANSPVTIDSWRIRYRRRGEDAWTTLPERNSGQTFTYISGVQEGGLYELAITAVSDSGVHSDSSPVVLHTVVGKTSPPPDIENLTAKIDAPAGITLAWDGITVLDLSHYVVSGAFGGKTVDNAMTLAAPRKTGDLSFSVVAVDTGGRTSKKPASVSIDVFKPATPAIGGEIRTDGLYVTWQDCKTTWPVHHYTIVDIYNNKSEIANTTSWLMPPRSEGDYDFQVIAVDIFQNSSGAGVGKVHVGPIYPPSPAITIDASDLVISWPSVGSAFPIATYEIAFVDGTPVASTKASFYRFTAPQEGTWEYRVRAIDVAGNISGWGETSIVLGKPGAPIITAALDGEGITLRWQATDHQLPIVAWDLVRQWEEVRDDGLIETHEEDYGRLDVDTLTVPAVSTGVHYFMVRAVDSAGNLSGWGDADFTVLPPGKVTFENCAAVDNNVMLYWTAPDTVFFPIREYVFSEIDEDGYEMEIGRIDAQFNSSSETVSGEYVYGVTPVDMGGNRGMLSTIRMTVSQPPDFVFYHNLDSLFNGTKTNFVLDGRGSMIGPVPNETWEANLARATQVAGKAIETWQDKISAGFTTWMAPATTSAVYVETMDVGKLVPSTKITVTISSRALSGAPVFACKIEVSQDGTEWRLIADNATVVYATQFRYVRYTITLRGGMAAISNINYSLDVKRKIDFGRVDVKADDNGDGWTSEEATPMLTGKWVEFNVHFIDVESFPKPNVVNDENLTAYTVFEDQESPKGFRIFIKDKNGNRAAGTVDWAAYGV